MADTGAIGFNLDRAPAACEGVKEAQCVDIVGTDVFDEVVGSGADREAGVAKDIQSDSQIESVLGPGTEVGHVRLIELDPQETACRQGKILAASGAIEGGCVRHQWSERIVGGHRGDPGRRTPISQQLEGTAKAGGQRRRDGEGIGLDGDGLQAREQRSDHLAMGGIEDIGPNCKAVAERAGTKHLRCPGQ